MASVSTIPAAQQSAFKVAADDLVLISIALAFALLHILTNNRYGFHRDELQFLSDARHLDWGFVAYPPLTPVIEHIGLSIFGVSLVWLRLFSVIAQAFAILITGWMTREFGGGRLAQVTAALAVALSGLPMFEATEFQYTSFEYLWWVLTCYFIVRLLKSEDPRWWPAIGVSIGLALETKYAVCFYIAGLLVAFLLTRSRRYLSTRWFAAGVGIALLIFLPNLIWQMHHDFISIHFLQHIHKRDVGEGRASGFLVDQVKICTNLFAAPLWIAGLICACRRSWNRRRYAPIALMYVVTLALFYFGKGRGYYLAEAYPVLVAMGTAASEQWISTLSRAWRRTLKGLFFAGLVAYGLLMCAILIPLADSGPLKAFALSINGDLREEFGWTELVKTVADIRDTLPPGQRQNVGILTGNYGEQGAIEILGSPYHLPLPISMTNSAWLRSYPATPPSALIVIGFSQRDAERAFRDCRLAGHTGNSEGVKNEESQYHPDVYVCSAPRLSWPEFWKEYQNYG